MAQTQTVENISEAIPIEDIGVVVEFEIERADSVTVTSREIVFTSRDRITRLDLVTANVSHESFYGACLLGTAKIEPRQRKFILGLCGTHHNVNYEQSQLALEIAS